jgi:hypothetical protein
MRSFIFLCDMSTEQECLDRHLFGTNAGENHQLHYSKVAVGDRLFLYNFETGILRGLFTAMTPCTYGLEPKAWKKTRRSFPWQVRVDSSGVSTITLRADDSATFILLAPTKIGLLPPSELSDKQVAQLLTLLLFHNIVFVHTKICVSSQPSSSLHKINPAMPLAD